MIVEVVTFLLLIRSIFPSDKGLRADFPGLESYRLDEFPPGVVGLHMSCEESNMFATNCACHIKCVERTCMAAWQLCEKYRIRWGKWIDCCISILPLSDLIVELRFYHGCVKFYESFYVRYH